MPRINKTQLAKLQDKFKPPERVEIVVINKDTEEGIQVINEHKKPTIRLIIRS